MSWIPINTTLPTSPKVVILASLLKCKRREAFGLIVEFFCWLDANFFNGHTHMTAKQINKLFDKKNFAEAMCEIGWGSIDSDGCYVVQEFETYNGKSTKARLRDSKKKQRQRDFCPGTTGTKSGQNLDKCPGVTETNVPMTAGLHNIIEDNIDSISPDGSIDSSPPKQSKAPQAKNEEEVLSYLASLPNCGLSEDELVACARSFFYQSDAVGWTISGQPIRNWRAAARAYIAKWQGNNASHLALKNTSKQKITYRSQTQQNYDLR